MQDIENLPNNFTQNLHIRIGRSVKKERELKSLIRLPLL